MKLPASSSLLLATLAISSSSSTLAAPAGEGDTAITTSSSNHHISAFLSSSGIHDLGSADGDIEQRANTTMERSEVDPEASQKTLVSAFLGLLHTLPIIGHPVASLIQKSFPNGTDSVEEMPNISPDDLKALQAAIAEVSRALGQDNQTSPGVSSAVHSGTTPTAMSNGDGLNTDSSISNAHTSATLADPTNTVSPFSRPSVDGSTTIDVAASTQTPPETDLVPPSPTIPGNPPNTPIESTA